MRSFLQSGVCSVRRNLSGIVALSAAVVVACGSNTSGPASAGPTSGSTNGAMSGASGGSAGSAAGAAAGESTGGASATTGSGASGGNSGATSGSGANTSSGASASGQSATGASGASASGASGAPGSSGNGGGNATTGSAAAGSDASTGNEGGDDASVTSDGSAGGEASVEAVTCGTTPAAFDVTQFGKMEQMSVAPDGTVYWSNQGASIGKYAPPYANGTIEATWKTIAGAGILGIALDPKRNVLYAGSRETADKLYTIDLATGNVTNTVTLPSSHSINGVTIGDDANVYYTDQSGGNVYRVGPTDTAPTKINTMSVAQGNDLAFGPDGWLYVNIWSPSPATIVRLNIQNGVAVAQELFVTLTGSGNGDGIAFDSAGNIYANAGGLYKVTPAKEVTKVAASGTAGIELGCGALSCNDLFYSTASTVSLLTVTPGGLNVYWHRP